MEKSTDAIVQPYCNKFGSHWGNMGYFGTTETDEDYPENPTRSIELYRQLQTVVNNPVAGAGLDLLCSFTLSSLEGDEVGIAVKPIETQRHIHKSKILREVNQLFSGFKSEDLRTIVWRFLAWGDCFASVVMNDDGQLAPRILPTWQVHLEADEWTGEITRVVQKRPGFDKPRDVDMDSFVHWAFRKNHLYGRSVFYESRDSARFYKQNSEDLAILSRESAIIPLIHEMPEGADEMFLEAYRRDHKQQLKYGPVSDIYVFNGASVSKAGSLGSASIAGMLESIKLRRLELAVATHLPLDLFGILDNNPSATDMMMQPAMIFKNFVGQIRMILAEQLYKRINKVLLERGYRPPYPYLLVFPEIRLNPWKEEIPDKDLDSDRVPDSDG